MFESNETLKNLTRFAKREYKKVEANSIKPRKDAWGKVWFTAKMNLNTFVITLDHLGFDFLPDIIKKLMVLLFLLAPIIAALICIRLSQETAKPDSGAKPEEEKKEDWISMAKPKAKDKSN